MSWRSLRPSTPRSIEQYALPWLEKHSTEDALLALAHSAHSLEAERGHDLCWLQRLAAQVGDGISWRAFGTERERRHDALCER
jgi:hypothetical protein